MVVLTELLSGAVQSRLHGCDAGTESLCDLGVAAPLLDEGEEGAVLGPELGEGVAEGVELLGVHGALGLGDVLVLRARRG